MELNKIIISVVLPTIAIFSTLFLSAIYLYECDTKQSFIWCYLISMLAFYKLLEYRTNAKKTKTLK